MAPADDDQTLESRPPRLSDLVSLCRDLNAEQARYVVIGDMAVIQAGFPRATGDVDLLIDVDPENQQRVRRALMKLPDAAVRDLAPGDFDRYAVVRVADEIVVDLMRAACGIEFAEASREVDVVDIEGVSIPFARPELLLRSTAHSCAGSSPAALTTRKRRAAARARGPRRRSRARGRRG